MPDYGKPALLLALPIVIVVGIIFGPMVFHDFISLDDSSYVTENPFLQNPGLGLAGVKWSLTSFRCSNWHPATWLSHMIDVRLFGLNPVGHHAMNLGFHCANTLLVYLFFLRTTGRTWSSFSVALLFGLHPLHVESVAWVAERKDLLAAFFWLMAMHLYTGYVRRPSLARYVTVGAALTAGLMAKPMAVTLPAIFLLLDFWPFHRFRTEANDWKVSVSRLLLEKVPFLALSAGSAVVTIYAQQQGKALVHLEKSPFFLNLGNAVISYVVYLRKCLWPSDLGVLYPFEPAAITPFRAGVASLILAAVTITCLLLRRRVPFLIWGWSWYLVTLLPVIGLIRVGSQAYADRYTYLPLIGIFIVFVWSCAAGISALRLNPLVPFFTTVLLLAALSICTRKQLTFWRSSTPLLLHTLEVSGDSWQVLNNLGMSYHRESNHLQALSYYRRAIALFPGIPGTYNNIGNLYCDMGNYDAALECYNKAIRLDLSYVDAYFNRGTLHLLSGDSSGARRDEQVLRGLSPTRADELAGLIRRGGGGRQGGKPISF